MSSINKSNLMTPGKVSSVKQVKAVLPQNSDQHRQSLAADGKNMPKANFPGKLTEAQRKEINRATKEVSGYIQNITRELNFSVDEELGKTVITVIDDETGDVIRQIPSEEILELAKNIANMKNSASRGFLFQGDA